MHPIRQLLYVLAVLSCGCATAFADGGQIRAVSHFRGYRMTVFTSPTPMRAGTGDISVLIQHAENGEIVANAAVAVELSRADTATPPMWSLATTESATNKLLQAAIFNIPEAGRWQVRIECKLKLDDTPWHTSFFMDVGPPMPQWIAIWPWLAWPLVAVGLYAVHRVLIWRRQRRGPAWHVSC